MESVSKADSHQCDRVSDSVRCSEGQVKAAERQGALRMDFRAELESVIQEIDREYNMESIWEMVLENLWEAWDAVPEPSPSPSLSSSPPPPPPPPPPSPAPPPPQPWFHPCPPVMSGGGSGCVHQGAASISCELSLMAAPQLNYEHVAPYTCQDYNVLNSGPVYSQGQYNHVTIVTLPDSVIQQLAPIGTVNREVTYGLPSHPPTTTSVTPPVLTCLKQTRRNVPQQDDGQEYIKKPPNAFMLFRSAQTPNVVAEMNITDRAKINSVLGKRWKLLSHEEKKKYFAEADRESKLHAQQHPNWSYCDNYGKRRKRVKRLVSTSSLGVSQCPSSQTILDSDGMMLPNGEPVLTPNSSIHLLPSHSPLFAFSSP